MGIQSSRPQKGRMLRPGASWMEDHESIDCHRCGVPFTMTRRRHHCRMCGAVFCSACCPADLSEFDRRSMTPEQRGLRVCRACKLPAWFLPVEVPRWSNPQASLSSSSAARLGGGSIVYRLDGSIMQTLLAFLDSRSRDSVLAVHPHIRHCLPIPDIPFQNSVSAVYPGVVAAGDAPFSGYFPKSKPPVPAADDPAKEPAKLGAGGFGNVYQAYDHRYQCLVAVKLVSKDFRTTQYKYDRTFATLSREVQVHKRLSEPTASGTGGLRSHIAPLVDVFQTRGNLVMVVNAGQGRTLRSAAREVRDADAGGVDPSRWPDIVSLALTALRDVCVALEYMAQNRLVHRDIKLDNIIMTRDYHKAYLIDFGMATELNAEVSLFPALGTASYMSPENLDCLVRRARGFHADRRAILAADVFSLGVAMHIMLANKRVYDSPKDFRANLLKARYGFHCDGPEWDTIPVEVRKLVRDMLQFDPYMRPTFQEIINHNVMKAPQFDAGGMCARRRERLRKEEDTMRDLWDFCDDIYDEDEDDPLPGKMPPPPAASSSSTSTAPKTTSSPPTSTAASVAPSAPAAVKNEAPVILPAKRYSVEDLLAPPLQANTRSVHTYVRSMKDDAGEGEDDGDEFISTA